MSDLKNRLIRLGNSNPSLQKHIRPVLDRITRSQSSRCANCGRSITGRGLNFEEGMEVQTPEGPGTIQSIDYTNKSPFTVDLHRGDWRLYKREDLKPVVSGRRSSRQADAPLREGEEVETPKGYGTLMSIDHSWKMPYRVDLGRGDYKHFHREDLTRVKNL